MKKLRKIKEMLYRLRKCIPWLKCSLIKLIGNHRKWTNLCASFCLVTKSCISKSKFLGGFSALSGSESLSTAARESKKMEEHLA